MAMMSIRALQLAVLVLALCWSPLGEASSRAAKIDREARAALSQLYRAQPGTRDVLARAHGILVFPGVYKAGIGIGAEYGRGALFKGGSTVRYYRLVSGSVGLQLGAQKRAQIIAFMDPAALERFERLEGWEIGVDGSVVLVDIAASGEISSTSLNQPIIGFILGEKGLMYHLNLEGSKISRYRP